ncbi:MAG: amidohydrolase family protein [Gemmatimonadota bacterium]|nr:MAG: amidohydrolase family protein [Gemmatimonadota bacterium]
MIPHRSSTAWVSAAALAGFTFFPSLAVAQFVEPPPPAAYALQDVTVVQADGSRAAAVSIVIRGGLIEAMGASVAIPADAEVLEGDSLLVFPGLIDAQGNAEYEFPDPDVERGQVRPWAPPRSVQSFMLHRTVVDHLTATGDDLADQRKQGVIAAAVHADGRLMPGRGAVLIYRKDAETPQQLVLRPTLGPVMSFRGAQGVYPTQVFAVMAFIRQSFEDARRDGIIHQEYARDPRGMPLPQWDPDYAVLREVMSGNQPVYFMADDAEDIRNVLTLADEYGFRPVIVGGGQAWKVGERLRRDNIPVLVSLDFPTPTRWEPEKQDPADSAGAVQEDMPLDPAALREKQELENLYSNPARLAEAGVTFALTSGGGNTDIREGVRKAVEYGLSEQAAMAAVTTVPAELLGIPQLVRIEEGMAANFVVADGELFDEDANIAYTFVAGILERGRLGRAPTPGDAPVVDMTGTWEVVIDGQMTATMTLTQEEGSVTGTFSLGDMGSGDVSGSVSGSDLTLTINVVAGGQSIDVEIEGTVSGNSASGDGSSTMGDFSWTATRTGGPGEETRT